MIEKMLSVIVLSYKNGDLIYETVNSIINQDYPNMEIIMAVDGDSDFNEIALETYLKSQINKCDFSYKILNNSVNLGTVKNLNNAIKESSGDYIKIIAGDDTYPDNKVFSTQINFLEKSENMVVYGNLCDCDIHMIEKDVYGFFLMNKYQLLNKENNELLKYVCRKNPKAMATQSACFKKVFFELHGAFDERFKYIEDLPMSIRILNSGIEFGYIDQIAVCHRNDSGISSSKKMFDIKRIEYYKELNQYFEICLKPLAGRVGKVYVSMRSKMCLFRIEFTNADLTNHPVIKRTLLIVKNIVPIMYYSLTNLRSAVSHMLKR